MPLALLLLLAAFGVSLGARRLGRGVGAALRAWRPAPDTASMSVRQARAILGVAADASREEVDAAYRRLMRRAHPDQGGTEGLAAQLNAARAVLAG